MITPDRRQPVEVRAAAETGEVIHKSWLRVRDWVQERPERGAATGVDLALLREAEYFYTPRVAELYRLEELQPQVAPELRGALASIFLALNDLAPAPTIVHPTDATAEVRYPRTGESQVTIATGGPARSLPWKAAPRCDRQRGRADRRAFAGTGRRAPGAAGAQVSRRAPVTGRCACPRVLATIRSPMSSRALADPELEQRRLAALHHVRQLGDPVLRIPASEVTAFDDALREEVARMEVIMDEAHGAGLAAPQLGAMRRILVYRVGDEEHARVLVNPRITWASDETETDAEGCLSIGEVTVEVARAVAIRVDAQDAEGAPLRLEAEGFEARVIQHEIDHLDGILILDRTTKEQRRQALRELRSQA